MTIAIDLSPLQGPHRLRGVGSVIINVLSNISMANKKEHRFVFYIEPSSDPENILKGIDLSDFNYEFREKPLSLSNTPTNSRLPGKFRFIERLINKQLTLYRFLGGLKGYDDNDIDVYLHTDQLQIMPRMHGVKKYMIAYDLIPYILEKDYLWSYKTSRHHSVGLVGSLATGVRRRTYITKVRINSKKAHKLLAISKQTKNDFVEYAGISDKKIELWYLGVNSTGSQTELPSQKYVGTTWGYFVRDFNFDANKPFLLYVGGTDARRKLDDLVIAFDHLRAEGHELQLIFAGDILQGPGNLPVKESRTALLNSSYKDDIIYLGFANEAVKNWLFEHALAFVYPSKYEGFGLPILDAMIDGTPVVTYQNSSITEVAGKAALYAHDALSIKEAIEKLLSNQELVKQYTKNGKKQASKFTWASTAENLIQIMAG